MTSSVALFSTLVLASTIISTNAFSSQTACPPMQFASSLSSIDPSITVTASSLRSPTFFTLRMSEEASAEAGDDNNEEEDQTEEATPEDLELTALKEEIAGLEAKLAEEKSKLEAALEECEEYSKTGYARKVADMENMKRVRSNIASTSQSSATAAVLRDFMPAYDTLNNLRQKYAEDEFGSKYSELNLQQTFANLGVTDFSVTPGEEVNNFRMKVLEKEISKDFAKDTVIREVSTGLELDGNVIRAASCVASLGTGEEEEESESQEGGEEAPTE